MKRDPRTLFIRDVSTGKIRITQSGKTAYRHRFAKAGYDIDRIRTLEEFESAVDAIFSAEFHDLAIKDKGKNPTLDRILTDVLEWTN
ncbi:MAG: hypothetical protein JXR29_13145 [Methylothermaceae bacterium]|nr:hypothetical protein [Methylothermaceae bacterium]